MFCQKCGKENADNTKFCVSCGNEFPVTEGDDLVDAPDVSSTVEAAEEITTAQPLAEMNVEEAGSAEISDAPVATMTQPMQSDYFGAEAEAPAEIPAYGSDSAAEVKDTSMNYFNTDEKPEKGKSKWFKVAACAVAVILLAIVVWAGVKFVGGIFSAKNADPILYIKDKEFMVRRDGKDKSYSIADVKASDYGFYYLTVQLSADGKLMFFAADADKDEFRLYYRKVNEEKPSGKDADSKGIRIASGVTDFTIQKDGKFVIYQKSDKLYYSDLKDEKTIASDVSTYVISKDERAVVFRKGEGDLYICGLGKNDEPEKVDSEVSYMVSTMAEYNKLYYVKDDALYIKEKGKDKVKITSDVSAAAMAGDQIYLTKEDKVTRSFDELFDDDCADSDNGITKPEYSDFQKEAVSSYGSYSFTYNTTDYDAYNKAYEEYRGKSERDKVREQYKNNPQETTVYTLYRVKGTEVEKVDEGLSDSDIEAAVDSNVIAFRKETTTVEGKIKLSEIKSYYEVSGKLSELSKKGTGEVYVSQGNNAPYKAFDVLENMDSPRFSKDGKYLYIIEDVSKSAKNGTLNRYTISSGSLTDKTKICDSVASYGYYLLENDAVIVNSNGGTKKPLGLFVNGKYTELSDNASFCGYKEGVLYYLDEYNSSKSTGTLMKFKGANKEQIDTDVHSPINVKSGDHVVYLKDYSSSSNRGDLYSKKGGGKSVKVDTDVSEIVMPAVRGGI